MKLLKKHKKNLRKKVENPKTQFRPSVSTDLVQNRTLVRPSFVYPLLVMEFNVHPGTCGVWVCDTDTYLTFGTLLVYLLFFHLVFVQ